MVFEDVNFMLEKAPGAYLRIGNGSTAPVHNAKYVSFRLEAKPVLEAGGGLGFCKADVLLEFLQMLLHQRNGSRGISALHARDDIRVFVMFAGCVAPRFVERDDERAARDDFLEITFQDCVVCKGRKLQVEGAGEPYPRRLVDLVHRGVLALQLIAQSFEIGWPGVLRGKPDDGRFEGAAGLKYLTRFFRRGRRDDGAAIRPQVHHVVVRKVLQGAPDDGASRAEQFAQRAFRQFGSRRQALVHDAVEHGFVDPCLQVGRRGVRPGLVGRLCDQPGGPHAWRLLLSCRHPAAPAA